MPLDSVFDNEEANNLVVVGRADGGPGFGYCVFAIGFILVAMLSLFVRMLPGRRTWDLPIFDGNVPSVA